MLRPKRMTPPRPNSRAIDLNSTGTWPPLKPAIRSRPIWRRSETGMCKRFYNFSVPNRGHFRASAPTRIDLAGGTIDIWPLYLFHDGACTVNAAISLRAHVDIEPRTDGRVELRSIDTGRQVVAASWRELNPAGELPLLSLAARHFALENATLVTRGESPAGAGIAGSSALTIATCGALAAWSGTTLDDDGLLQTAMNIECQTIHVPTGVQDYRPALYGGVAAIELRVDRIARVGLSVDPKALEDRIVLAYTGAPRNSGTNNWEITKKHIDGDR